MEDQGTLLELRNVNFRYNKKTQIIKNANLKVGVGEIVGISGENGSGKSTLLKLIIGLLKPNSGEIIQKGKIGYSPQNQLLFENLTVLENFKIFGKGMDLLDTEIEAEAIRIMDKLNFSKYRNTQVKKLSGGTAQKVNFGISMLGDPDILILDEPYQGMDYASFLAFWEIQFELRKEGKSVVIVSHLIEDQEKFSKAVHLVNGKIQGCTRVDCPNCGR